MIKQDLNKNQGEKTKAKRSSKRREHSLNDKSEN
jgi:hypothetical protein